MKLRRVVGAISVAVVLGLTALYGSKARATSFSTDQSDLWWIPAESGWGMQIVHQGSVLFATMFVYDAAGKPTWYVATLDYGGLDSNDKNFWTGTLYATTGPWFGTVPFDPATVTATPVGSMTFTAEFIETASLTYSVDGVVVNKAITRQVLVYENFNGTFFGIYNQQVSGAGCPADANTAAAPLAATIAQADTAMTVTVLTGSTLTVTCTYSGVYSQVGHFGALDGNYTCSNGDFGSFVFYEMANSFYSLRARFSSTSAATDCSSTGQIVGLRQ
ncbi:MAG TPA: hypothetical protein VF814_02445 [Casimicrobiaceae bacterium]